MLFDSLPGIPADNRWKTIEPFLGHFAIFLITNLLRGWLHAFEGEPTYEEDQPEIGDEETVQRIVKGRRIRRVNEIVRNRNDVLSKTLVALATSQPPSKFLSLMLRDVGAMKRCDWRVRARSGERLAPRGDVDT